MKRFAYALALLMGWGLTSPAQPLLVQSQQRRLLGQWAKVLEQQHPQRWEALTLRASREGWPLRQTYSNGRVLVLQEIDSLGRPIYYTNHSFGIANTAHKVMLPPVAVKGLSTNVTNRLGLWDDGQPLLSHQELSGRVQVQDRTTLLSEHTTHLAGIMIGAGLNASAKGVASGARLRVWDFSNDILEMTTAAPSLLVSNHSYGVQSGWNYNPDRPGTDDTRKWEWWGDEASTAFEDFKFGYYDTKARDLDKIAFLAPYYLIVKSADNKRGETGPPAGTPYFIRNTNRTSTAPRHRNDAYGTIPMEANAKNILTIGATFATKSTTPKPQDIQMTYFSSWGPTDDGRIKPDLVAEGMEVLSASSRGASAYATYSGTSVAAPKVAASLLLLQEYYAQRNAGNFMRAATLKALAIHGATEAGRSLGPDYEFGWGLFNLDKSLQLIDDTAARILENVLSQGSTYSLQITAQGNQPIKVTLSWTDPEATPLSTALVNNPQIRLVNDLDLRISDGLETSLPWTLNPAAPSLPAVPADNTRDNVEQVLIPVPVPGKTYTILVSHKNSLRNTEQAFSIVVSGISRTGCQLTAGVSPSSSQAICSSTGSVRLYANTGTNFRHQWLKDGTVLSNRTSSYLDVTQSGRYQVRITQGGCSVTSPSVSVTASQVSASIAAAGSTSLCVGGSVRLYANSGTNYTYQWQRNGVTIPGATAPYYTATLAGSYSVLVQEGPCLARSAATVVSINTLQAVVTPPPSRTICNGQALRLNTSAPTGSTYQWFRDGVAQPNSNSPTFFAWQAGNYAVRITNGSCQNTSAGITLSAQSLRAEVVPSGTVSFCNNLTLSANTGSGYTYQWLLNGQAISGATRPTLTLSSPGSYAVRIQSGTCTVSSSVVAALSNAPTARITPLSSTIFAQGGAVTLHANSVAGASYQWFRNGTLLSGATGSSYIARESGNYTVRVGQSTCSTMSGIIAVSVTPRNGRVALLLDDTTPALSVYPNPASDLLHLVVQNADPSAPPQWQIADATGRIVLRGTLELQHNGNFSAEINVVNLQNGTYLVNVAQGLHQITKAFLKQ